MNLGKELALFLCLLPSVLMSVTNKTIYSYPRYIQYDKWYVSRGISITTNQAGTSGNFWYVKPRVFSVNGLDYAEVFSGFAEREFQVPVLSYNIPTTNFFTKPSTNSYGTNFVITVSKEPLSEVPASWTNQFYPLPVDGPNSWDFYQYCMNEWRMNIFRRDSFYEILIRDTFYTNYPPEDVYGALSSTFYLDSRFDVDDLWASNNTLTKLEGSSIQEASGIYGQYNKIVYFDTNSTVYGNIVTSETITEKNFINYKISDTILNRLRMYEEVFIDSEHAGSYDVYTNSSYLYKSPNVPSYGDLFFNLQYPVFTVNTNTGVTFVTAHSAPPYIFNRPEELLPDFTTTPWWSSIGLGTNLFLLPYERDFTTNSLDIYITSGVASSIIASTNRLMLDKNGATISFQNVFTNGVLNEKDCNSGNIFYLKTLAGWYGSSLTGGKSAISCVTPIKTNSPFAVADVKVLVDNTGIFTITLTKSWGSSRVGIVRVTPKTYYPESFLGVGVSPSYRTTTTNENETFLFTFNSGTNACPRHGCLVEFNYEFGNLFVAVEIPEKAVIPSIFGTPSPEVFYRVSDGAVIVNATESVVDVDLTLSSPIINYSISAINSTHSVSNLNYALNFLNGTKQTIESIPWQISGTSLSGGEYFYGNEPKVLVVTNTQYNGSVHLMGGLINYASDVTGFSTNFHKHTGTYSLLASQLSYVKQQTRLGSGNVQLYTTNCLTDALYTYDYPLQLMGIYYEASSSSSGWEYKTNNVLDQWGNTISESAFASSYTTSFSNCIVRYPSYSYYTNRNITRIRVYETIKQWNPYYSLSDWVFPTNTVGTDGDGLPWSISYSMIAFKSTACAPAEDNSRLLVDSEIVSYFSNPSSYPFVVENTTINTTNKTYYWHPELWKDVIKINKIYDSKDDPKYSSSLWVTNYPTFSYQAKQFDYSDEASSYLADSIEHYTSTYDYYLIDDNSKTNHNVDFTESRATIGADLRQVQFNIDKMFIVIDWDFRHCNTNTPYLPKSAYPPYDTLNYIPPWVLNN